MGGSSKKTAGSPILKSFPTCTQCLQSLLEGMKQVGTTKQRSAGSEYFTAGLYKVPEYLVTRYECQQKALDPGFC